VRLQREIWGWQDVDVLPVRICVVARKVGGQVFGAFSGDKMIGFCFSLPAIKPDSGATYLHSNMLGVDAAWRNHGVGKMLKLAQRDDALARGFTLMEWTFDPLEIKNAFFNIERLGAVVKRYVLNQYGITTSALHGSLPTDRCICEWYLESDRVKAILSGNPLPRSKTEATIELPIGVRTREVQQRVSSLFLEYTAQGLAATGVELAANTGAYLFTRYEP
jgi:predicted GNAT superfamily acetyltransferase